MVELGIPRVPGLGGATARTASESPGPPAWAAWLAADAFEFAPTDDAGEPVMRCAPSAPDAGPDLTEAGGALRPVRVANSDREAGHAETLIAAHVGGHEPADRAAPPASLTQAVARRGGSEGAPADAAARRLDAHTSGQGALGVESDFNIKVVFAPGMPDGLREEFILAAEYLSAIITGDLPDRGRIDDISIRVRVLDIDGEGEVLGQAAPGRLRPGSFLPLTGVMEFDKADAAQLDADGQFHDVVVHEMMHCLGFGTTWRQVGLLAGSIRGGDLRFVGEGATLAYPKGKPGAFARDPDADRGVPVETDGGPGMAGGHWDEKLFRRDLMTAFVDPTTDVSAVTVAALEDMGYETVWDAATPGAAPLQPSDLLLVG